MTYLHSWMRMIAPFRSQNKVAEMAGVDATHLGKIASGRVKLTLEMARRLVAAFGSEIDAEKLYSQIGTYTDLTPEEQQVLGAAIAQLDSQ